VALSLPTEKSSPTLTASSAKVLLYGWPKIGKTTLAAGLDPEHTLFLATEPGHGALSIFKVDIGSWQDFRNVGALLSGDTHAKEFNTVVIDTVDELFRMCEEYVLADLGISHASDAGYGKGWAAISNEWRLRISKFANLGFGTWFISHAKDVEIEQRVGKLTKTVPTLPGRGWDFLEGFCDYILFATSEQTPDGEQRILHTSAAEHYIAGGRRTLPDPLPLDPKAVWTELEKAGK
jgi:hypothetical protein